ncbi:MAG: copper amine oxidase [Clostridiaceae bacterium]|nr:copper amine oxidase [Clostridiaceae bacterium]
MKKIFVLVFIALFSIIFSINTFASSQLKLFYDNRFFNLSQEIITQGNEYFINAKELNAVIGTSCKIDLVERSLTIKIGDLTTEHDIKSYDYTILDASSISHNSPELINKQVYLPFNLVAELYSVNIKYDKKANMLYLFPIDTRIDTFTNAKHNYTLSIPENVYLELNGSYDSFDSSSISIISENSSFSASIICDSVNNTTIKNMRFLLSDYISPNDYIFDRIVEYKQSYFRSLMDSYKNEFLFGNLDKDLSESNIKIIRDYSEELFGQNSNIILFNTISSNKFTSTEDTNLFITIPSYENETIYSLTFSMEKGTLNDQNINNIIQIIKGLNIANLTKQENVPEILFDQTSIATANIGIYPNLQTAEKEYTVLEDTLNSFRIKYPESYIPYLQNSFIDNHSYRSFKINHNSSFSITVEHLTGKSDRISSKIDSLKSFYRNKITVINERNEHINGKEYTILNYELDNTYTKEFVTNYYIIKGLRLYTIQLNCLMLKPTEDVISEFKNIVASFEFIESQNKKEIIKPISFVKYTNERDGYSIFYPDDWSFQDSSQDINYDFIEITNPNFSGPLSIYINESEYTSNLTTIELLRYTSGYDSSLEKYFKNYKTPYANKTYKLLNSNVTTNDDITIIYKLVNYIDEGDRYKMCYSIDLIRNKKINSLFISTSEYLFQDGVLADKDLNYILEYMTKSFSIEETQSNLFASKERNNKILFIENFFKKAYGDSTTVTFAKNLTSEKDVLVYLSGTDKAGAYRLNYDYNNRKLYIVARVLNDDIVKYSEKKMMDMLKTKYVHRISINSEDMIINVRYSNTPDSTPVNRSYYILVNPSRKGYSIDFVAKLNVEVVRDSCKTFLENYLLTDVEISFPKYYNYTNENLNKYYFEKRIIPIFAEFDGQSGYFYLEIDPLTNSVKILEYISMVSLKEKIEEHYFLIDPSITVLDFQNVNSNNFSFNVSLSSAKNTQSKEVLYMYYDQEVLFLAKDPYFLGISSQ